MVIAILKEENDEFSQAITSVFREAFNGTENELEIFEKGNKSVEEEAKDLIEKGFVVVVFIPENFSKIMFSTIGISIFYAH